MRGHRLRCTATRQQLCSDPSQACRQANRPACTQQYARWVVGPDPACLCGSMTTPGTELDESLARDDALAERAREGSGSAFAVLVTRPPDPFYSIPRNISSTILDAAQVLHHPF